MKKFGIKRSRETTKPAAGTFKMRFFQCENCNNIFQQISSAVEGRPVCCDHEMVRLRTKKRAEISSRILIDYRIIGGYNDNAVEVTWGPTDENDTIEWVFVKTFTGGQIKYVQKNQKKSFVFALAGEDAYVYCDEDPCLECAFRCKWGFEIYVYLNQTGLIKIPIDRMQTSW